MKGSPHSSSSNLSACIPMSPICSAHNTQRKTSIAASSCLCIAPNASITPCCIYIKICNFFFFAHPECLVPVCLPSSSPTYSHAHSCRHTDLLYVLGVCRAPFHLQALCFCGLLCWESSLLALLNTSLSFMMYPRALFHSLLELIMVCITLFVFYCFSGAPSSNGLGVTKVHLIHLFP